MDVLFFNWRCWLNPLGGGAERFTYEVARRLVERGCRVSWFTSRFPGCKREEVVDGIRLVRAGGKYTVYLEAKKYYKKCFLGKFDIIIDEINTRPFMTVDFVKDAKVVALIHQLAREFWSYETVFPVLIIGRYFLEDRWLRKYSSVPTVTVSNSTMRDLENLGFREVYVVSEGLNLKPVKKVSLKEETPTVIFLGRLRRVKQPDHVLKAFKVIKERIPEAQLWIVGDGPLRVKLERERVDGVRVFGYVSEEEKVDLLRRAHILLFPGVREGWGLTVVEAASQGTPTIGYDIPGLRDSIKDGLTGVLVAANDYIRMGLEAVRLLQDREMLMTLSANALNYSRGFSWDTTARQFYDILKKVCSRS